MTVAEHSKQASGKGSEKFIGYIHHFRGIAILFVVACHLLLDWQAGSETYKILELLFGNGTVLFVFIAGYLFQHLTPKLEYLDYLKKKGSNVLIPYLLVSTPIIVYRLATSDIPGYITDNNFGFSGWSIWEQVVYFLTHGAHMQPLWFIPMISLFYIAAPVFFYIDQHPKLYYLLFPLIVLSLFVEREPFSDILKMFVHFLSVYIFGMFMSRYKIQFMEFAKRFYLLISILLILSLLANYIFYENWRNPINYVQKMLFCPFFIYWLWRFEKFVPSFISYLAEISFGVFFLHYYAILVIKAIFEIASGRGIPGTFFYWVIDYFLVLLSTAAVIYIIKKLFGKRSRSLIGC